MIKVGISGINGRMGRQVLDAVNKDSELELVFGADKFGVGDIVAPNVEITSNLQNANIADIVIDFTQPSCVFENIKTYLNMHVKSVIGTTGLKEEQIEEIRALSAKNNTGIIIAPNFSIGAILMMKFAKEASKYFSNAEILEFHHNQKKDAPSGTSIKTAQLMAEVNSVQETETILGARGGNCRDIQIHSIRVPGFIASQEVIFGADGETFKIRHDTINRECYMKGVVMAVKYLYEHNEFIYGLENII